MCGIIALVAGVDSRGSLETSGSLCCSSENKGEAAAAAASLFNAGCKASQWGVLRSCSASSYTTYYDGRYTYCEVTLLRRLAKQRRVDRESMLQLTIIQMKNQADLPVKRGGVLLYCTDSCHHLLMFA